MNQMVISPYSGSVIAIAFEGDKDYCRRGAYGLINFAGLKESKYFEFSYFVGTPEGLKKGLCLQGATKKLSELWRAFRESGRKMASVTQEEEKQFELEAAEFGAKFAEEELARASHKSFMTEICAARREETKDEF